MAQSGGNETSSNNFQSYFPCPRKTFIAYDPKDGRQLKINNVYLGNPRAAVNGKLSTLLSSHSTVQVNGSYFLKKYCSLAQLWLPTLAAEM
jgi:hypothetical protein